MNVEQYQAMHRTQAATPYRIHRTPGRIPKLHRADLPVHTPTGQAAFVQKAVRTFGAADPSCVAVRKVLNRHSTEGEVRPSADRGRAISSVGLGLRARVM